MTGMRATKHSAEYGIGIITALPIERAAFTAMLDARHMEPLDFSRFRNDNNAYTFGQIGRHNVVVTSLAAGAYGTTTATTTALPMLATFPSIKCGLMVGIGAGIPSSQHDIRLGDVVVSQPTGNSGGVVQYDLGKAMNGEWERRDLLTRPPDALLSALAYVQSEHELTAPEAYAYLAEVLERSSGSSGSFGHPDKDTDRLFAADYSHQSNGSNSSCSQCDASRLLQRPARTTPDFQIHYGLIASGNSVVKDAQLRDQIGRNFKDCLCIEMEAAGLMNSFPCLVIRGICDYGDTHKNDNWRRYASITAAAFAKELLYHVPSDQLQSADSAAQVVASEKLADQLEQSLTLDTMSDTTAVPFSRSTDPNPDAIGIDEDDEQESDIEDDDASVQLDLEPQESKESYDSFFAGIEKSGKCHMGSTLRANRTDMAIQMIDRCSNANLNSGSGSDGCSMMFDAAYQGNADIILRLLARGADIDAGNKFKRTPLMMAAYLGREDIVDLLIAKGAGLEVRSRLGYTPLTQAALGGSVTTTLRLLKLGADIESALNDGCTSLHLAAEKGHTSVLRLLLEWDADVDKRDKCRETALHVACRKGQLDCVMALLKRDADIEAETDKRRTPLHLASIQGHPDVVEALLENKAESMARDKFKTTPLHLAAREGWLDVVNMLLARGNPVDTRGQDSWTCLHYVAEAGHIDTLEALLHAGADIQARTRDGDTALHIAAAKGHLEVVRVLLKSHAKVHARNLEQQTPLHRAAKEGHSEIAKTLIKAGAEVDAIDKKALTPLALSVQSGHSRVVQVLLANGANAAHKTDSGKLVEIATKAKDTEIKTLLQKHISSGQTGASREPPTYEAAIR